MDLDVILVSGIFVFVLLVIGLILTVREFNKFD